MHDKRRWLPSWQRVELVELPGRRRAARVTRGGRRLSWLSAVSLPVPDASPMVLPPTGPGFAASAPEYSIGYEKHGSCYGRWRPPDGRLLNWLIGPIREPPAPARGAVIDIATPVCITQTTPASVKEGARALRCPTRSPWTSSEARRRVTRGRLPPQINAGARRLAARKLELVLTRPAPDRTPALASGRKRARESATLTPRGFPWMPAGPAPCFWRGAGPCGLPSATPASSWLGYSAATAGTLLRSLRSTGDRWAGGSAALPTLDQSITMISAA